MAVADAIYGTGIYGESRYGVLYDNLIATDLEVASEVDTATISQLHVLNATSVETASEVNSPVLAQVEVLISTDLEVASEVSTPTLTQLHVLVGNSIEIDTEVSVPVFAENYQFVAVNVEMNTEITGGNEVQNLRTPVFDPAYVVHVQQEWRRTYNNTENKPYIVFVEPEDRTVYVT